MLQDEKYQELDGKLTIKKFAFNQISTLDSTTPYNLKDKCISSSSFELKILLPNSNPVYLQQEEYLLISGEFLCTTVHNCTL